MAVFAEGGEKWWEGERNAKGVRCVRFRVCALLLLLLTSHLKHSLCVFDA